MSTLGAALNAVCPYFTMFPIGFPLRVLSRGEGAGGAVLDPFCGRGTTNVAARLLELPSTGMDSHPVAVALTKAKVVSTNPKAIVGALDRILSQANEAAEVPTGDFWELAFEESTLNCLVKVRNALIQDCRSPARVALRAITLGALHGPIRKGQPSYLSNQCPRTYAPKPRYAVNFWRKNNLRPMKADLRTIVARRAAKYYSDTLPEVDSQVLLGDSRDEDFFRRKVGERSFNWVITSPPYYGLRTYRPDQWLRLWFLGGPAAVDYSQQNQVTHGNPEDFARQLSRVWQNCASVCRTGARMVIRFGQISDRRTDPVELLRESLLGTGWRVQTRCDAGSAALGKRQADHFGVRSAAQQEFDLWAVRA